MKKLFTKILLLCVMIGCLLFSGCMITPHAAVYQKNVETLISCIDNRDREGLKKLFAPNALKKVEGDFDEKITELFNYYEGEFQSRGGIKKIEYAEKNHGDKMVEQDLACDVTTTVEVFRIGLTWRITDTAEPDNVGIWYCAVLKFKDDPTSNLAYYGGGTPTEYGIAVGEHWMYQYIKK